MDALTKVMRFGAAAVVIVMCVSTARAQLPDTEHKKMGKKWEEKFNEMIKELRLSPEQQQAITQQRAKDKAASQELRQKIHVLREEIGKELDKETTDMNVLNGLMAQIKELTVQRIDQQIQSILATKKILTAEQFRKLNEKLKADREHGRGEGGGP